MSTFTRSLSLLTLWLLGFSCISGCQNDSQTGPPKTERPPAPVEVASVEQRELVVQHSYLGEVVARSDASLSTAEAGRILRVLVEEGAKVKAGQLLVVLDDRLARAELGEAVASKRTVTVEERQASREAQRYERMHQEDVVSDLEATQQTDQAERLALQAQGAEETVKVRSERVKRYRIVAPFDGVVAQRLVDPGDWLTPGQTALQLVTTKHVEVLVRVPEQLLSSLPDLIKVEVVSQDRRATASLAGVVNALDPATRTGLLRVTPDAAPGWLLPGASVDGVFSIKRRDGWVVPRDALVYGIGEVRLFTVRDGQAKPIPVKVLHTAEKLAMVQGELSAGQSIITRGNERLRPGQAVRVLEEPKKP